MTRFFNAFSKIAVKSAEARDFSAPLCISVLAIAALALFTPAFVSAATGTFQGFAFKDGQPWNGASFSVTYSVNSGTPVTAPITAPFTYSGVPTGTYSINSVSNPSADITFDHVDPYSQNLSDGGTSTFNFYFKSAPTTGTFQVLATKDGQPWNGASFSVNYTGPSGTPVTAPVTAPFTYSGVPTGPYSINGVSNLPAGVSYVDVTPSATQTLNPGGTVKFQFNFTSGGGGVAAFSKYYRAGADSRGNLGCPAGWNQIDSWTIYEGDSADGGGGDHSGVACSSGVYKAAFSKYYRTNDPNAIPPCPSGWTQVDSWAVQEGDHNDGGGGWHGGVACASNSYTGAISKYVRDQSWNNWWGNPGSCPGGTEIDSWTVNEGDSDDGGGGTHVGRACAYSNPSYSKVFSKYYRTKTALTSCPSGESVIDSWGAWEGDPTDGGGGWHFGVGCAVTSSPPPPSSIPPPATGTVIVNATKDGQAWNPPSFPVSFTSSGQAYTTSIQPPQTYTAVGAGFFAINGVTPPPGVTYAGVSPSSATLTDGGTITFTFNFLTTTAPSGTVSIRSTLNGSQWPPTGKGTLILDALTPTGPLSNISVDTPSDNPNQPAGAYTVTYKSGGPPGATLSSITPSASQNLSANNSITFTFNFVTTSPPPPPPPPPPPLNKLPIGTHDGTDNASCTTFGWATDPDNTSIPLSVNLYSDGTLVKTVSANQNRADLTGVCSGGNCSFSTSLSGLIPTGVIHSIRASALDAQTGEEVNLSNTPKSITCVAAAPPPDLIISVPPSVNSGTLVAGQTLTFKATVKNQGGVTASGTFNNRFRVDANNDGIIDASDPDITPYSTITNLAAGASQQIISAGWTATAGTHGLYVCADRPPASPGVIAESDENNNCAWGLTTFTVANAATPTLVVVPSSATVDVGGTQQFGAIYDPDGPTGPLPPVGVTVSALWSSSDNSIASVDALGKATGKAPGSAMITASYSGLTAFALLTVTAPVPTFRVTPSSASVAMGDTKQFTAIYDPDGSGSQPPQDVTATATWVSSDATKVTVAGGLATRVGHGLTLISASYKGMSDRADVVDPAMLRIAPPSAILNSGATVQLVAWYDPDGFSGSKPEQNVTSLSNWSSGNPTVASVDNASSKGLVTAGSTAGFATISASYTGLSANAGITVSAPSLSVSCSASPTSVTTGQSVTWTATASGGTGSYSYSWSGSSPLGGRIGNPVIVSYTTAGTKTGSVTAISGIQTVSQVCSTSVSVVAAPAVPAAPSSLRVDSASLNTCGTIRLTWTDNANNEERFELERDSGSGFANIANLSANTISFTDTTVSQNSSYSYRVRACNTVGCSTYSNIVTGNNQSPRGDFKWSPQTPQVNQPTLFTDVSTPFGGATIIQRQWTFQGGNPAAITSARAATTTRFVNANPAQKSVVLRVTDSVSRACSVTKSVSVVQGTIGDWCELTPDAPPGTPCP